MKAALTWAALASAVLVAGCGGDSRAPSPRPDNGSPPAPAKALTVGTAATINYGALDDPDGGGALTVTVTKVSDPLSPPTDDDFVSKDADPGGRYVAVHVRIQNVGDRVYNDALYGSTQLVDDQGNVAEAAQLIGWSCESAFNAAFVPLP